MTTEGDSSNDDEEGKTRKNEGADRGIFASPGGNGMPLRRGKPRASTTGQVDGKSWETAVELDNFFGEMPKGLLNIIFGSPLDFFAKKK